MHPDHVKILIKEILQAMAHANIKHLMHRNLKCENIILKGNIKDNCSIKISDFNYDPKGTDNVLGLPNNPLNLN